jgi:LexA-binding, inner membrane-associated putative hydrolase
MMAPTHRLGAAAGWLGGCLLANPGHVATFCGALLAAISGPQCDLDNLATWSRVRTRYSRKRQPVRYWLTRMGARFRKHPVKYRIALFLSVFGRHRLGPSHSVIIAALVGLFLTAPWTQWPAWPWWVGPAIALGLASHIGLDLMNRSPVAVTWPVGEPVKGLGIRVGKAAEELLIRPVLGLAVLGLAWLIIRGG